MIKNFSQTKPTKFFYFLLLFLLSFFARGQNPLLDIEKIYLHTDRSTYFMGEDLWYKAYNVRASNNLLFDNSNILYVELINDDSKIIARNKTNLEMGLGHGDFHLADSVGIKPGVYQLRAYTNWNRNFGDDFVFKKEIEIFDVFDNNSESKTKNIVTSSNTTKSTVNKNTLKVDFFPEGGTLLENVTNIIGFKAVDTNGKPLKISGEIYDSTNELTTTFESVHDGMGKLQLLPIEGKKYYARIKTENGFEFQQDLPKALKNGFALSYRNFKGKNILTISTNLATLAQNLNVTLKLVCQIRGINYLETTQTLTETSLSFELPKEKIPDGISQITLFDNLNKPQSERLVYFEKVQDLNVKFSTDKTTYQPEEKATIMISSKSKSGEGKSASFSLSVTDSNGVDDENFDSNICSYFLMESDIRGKVYHPAYYFDANNPKRLEHLDNLLLTQGWRDYVWKTLTQIEEKNVYKAEKGITISGRVKQLFANKPLVNNNVTLALMGKKSNGIFSEVTDSMGYFKFEDLLFSEKTYMYLNSTNEKGRFKGEIILDSIEHTPMFVTLKKELIGLPTTTNLIVKNVSKKYTAFGVKPENQLGEVKIIGKTRKYATVFYGVPEFKYIADEQIHLFTNISDLMKEVMPPNLYGKVLIDGELLEEYSDEGALNMVSPRDVLKIEYARGDLVKQLYGFDRVISIFTNGKKRGNVKKETNHSIKKEIEGFYTARAFYSPNPEKLDVEMDNMSAVRNTIYWNPYVHPDKAGNASVNYYNTKVDTKVKINLEGITGGGIPVVKNLFYSIKK